MKMIAVFSKRGMLAQHARELEPVELGHADVDENDRDIVLQQERQRLACRSWP